MTSASQGDTLSFAQDIRPLFREKDRNSMRRAFDLFDYSDVAGQPPAGPARPVRRGPGGAVPGRPGPLRPLFADPAAGRAAAGSLGLLGPAAPVRSCLAAAGRARSVSVHPDEALSAGLRERRRTPARPFHPFCRVCLQIFVVIPGLAVDQGDSRAPE